MAGLLDPERLRCPAQGLLVQLQALGAHEDLFLVTGAGKQAAIAAWRKGELIPAARVRGLNGVDVLVERVRTAAGGTESQSRVLR